MLTVHSNSFRLYIWRALTLILLYAASPLAFIRMRSSVPKMLIIFFFGLEFYALLKRISWREETGQYPGRIHAYPQAAKRPDREPAWAELELVPTHWWEVPSHWHALSDWATKVPQTAIETTLWISYFNYMSTMYEHFNYKRDMTN